MKKTKQKKKQKKEERNGKEKRIISVTLKTMKSLNPAVMSHVLKIDISHCIEGFNDGFLFLTGYGFVNFETPAAAQRAVKALKSKGIQAQMAKVLSLCI